jgi:hypothetical protein
MSEHQYYEFLAIDRPLSEADQEALRALSSRAQIDDARFVNTYNWGDFNGDPEKLMTKWFDLHLYWANWGTRRLMMRLPKQLVDRMAITPFISEVEDVSLQDSGKNLILDIHFNDMDNELWDEGPETLAPLAPLRAAILQGDLRMFYLIWLMAVEFEMVADNTPEPAPGLGPMTKPLSAFASFFDIDLNLIEAAAERPASPHAKAATPKAIRSIIETMAEDKKNDFLARLYKEDPHAGVELRRMVEERLRDEAKGASVAPRTAGELRARVEAIRVERGRVAAEKAAAQSKLQAEQEEKARSTRLSAVAKRGAAVWTEIESEIERCNADGYDRAASLLRDLHALAKEDKKNPGATAEFLARVNDIRTRHARKQRFIARLAGIE